jgi:feruloyl esterase
MGWSLSGNLAAIPRTLKFLAAASVCVPLLSMPAFSQVTSPAVSCASLAKLTLPDTTITTAHELGAGEFKFPPHPPGSGGYPSNMDEAKIMPAFCMVEATIKPTKDSDIKIEVWLPLKGWNGKFIGVGNGGWGGRISHAGMITGVLRGYAAASTDSGHDVMEDKGSGGFLLGHPEKLIDLGYRAVHLMTTEGKEITQAFYGAAPRHSYFYGTGLGGFQALMEANRFPEDYDGISAGNPQTSWALSGAEQLWASWLIAKDPSRLIPEKKFVMVHEAVLKMCDELDGMKDGVIQDPGDCHFDPQILLCKDGDSPDCLTAPQVDLLRKIYQGPVNPRTKKNIISGPAVGSELEMSRLEAIEPRQLPVDLYKYVVFQNSNWDWRTLNYDSDIDQAVNVIRPVLNVEPNFKSYVAHGGKLFIYVDWVGDNNPKQVIGYYHEMLGNMGGFREGNYFRMFAIAGRGNCSEGNDCAIFDKLNVLERWVETGIAPDQIKADSMVGGKLIRTRRLCSLPNVPLYKGTGSTDDADNFICGEKPAVKR